ncbi:hypothetical protein HHK36_031157 [Tetracentron sinense]|uniref:Uncharacterized protein n=1 Tax=Tetracentron sinense TaxID=13715 RepID=A0A835CZB5_TETSI|nr:hypothetical protein HHK36_031157 [Tetracentron sinense]
MELEVDHYEILGLPSGEEGAKLTVKEISKAYKSKALELHPDKRLNDPNAHANFQKLKSSYEILKDEKARKLFDDLIRIKRDHHRRQSQYNTKRRKMMSDLEERERAAFAPDPTEIARKEEERIYKKLKEEIARIRSMHAKKATTASKVDMARMAAESVGNGMGGLDKERVLKVSWEKGGEDYTAQRLRELFGKFGDVEDVVIKGSKKKNSALVVMASKDAVVAATGSVCGDLSNPLLVLPLQPAVTTGFSNASPSKKYAEPDGPKLDNLVGAGYQSFENSVLKKLQKDCVMPVGQWRYLCLGKLIEYMVHILMLRSFERNVVAGPQEEGFREICGLLEQHISPTSDKPRIWQQLQHYSQFPDFNNYLAFILARAEGKSVEIRQAAGLLLKNNLRTAFKSMAPAYQQYIKSELLPCLGAADRHIRSTVGTIISVLVQQGRIFGWPELLQALVQCLDSNDVNHMEGAMDALSKICEDIPQELDLDVPGLAERPINVFMPRLFQALHLSMDQYLQGLFVLSHDPIAEVRKLFLQVCAAFVQLIEIRPSFLEPHLRNVIEYMLQANKDADDEVCLEACEFWSAYCEAQLRPESLREYLPRLIPVLLLNMVYAEDDESLVDAEEDETFPDKDQDLKPRFHSSRFHGSDNAEDDDDDIVNIWNLRKCSAAALDILSNVFGDEILTTLMPVVQAKLSSTDDVVWKEREAAVLALGAIAEGCITGLYPHLPEVKAGGGVILRDYKGKFVAGFFPFYNICSNTIAKCSNTIAKLRALLDGLVLYENLNLESDRVLAKSNGSGELTVTGSQQIVVFLIPLLDDKFPLIRSITCWTISRFSKFIVQGLLLLDPKLVKGSGHQNGREQFDKVLMGLLRRILDTNKRVQEAACSAFATLEEEAAEELAPHLEIILQHLLCAFGKYQKRNLRIVYDAIGTLADAVGGELNQPRYLDILMPPLIAKWQQLLNSDKDLFPLLECFTSIAQVDPGSAGVQYDKEFVVCSLDLLSGLAEGLGSGIESLVVQSNLRDLLLQCCMDDALDVRQSALALLGDLARNTPTSKDTVSVANNACWAIGELAIKVHQEISPIVMTVISCLVPILQQAEGLNKSLIENSAITLGRLAWVCPELVSPHMEHFMQSWCTALSMIRDDVEKEDAFRGLCAMVRANPSGALSSLIYMCKAIASWHEIRSEDLHNEVCQVLHGYKQMLRNGAWEQCMSALESPVKDKLSKYEV